MDDDDIVGAVGEGERLERRNLDIDKSSSVGGARARAFRSGLVGDDDRGLTGQARLGRERARHERIIDADLQRALTHAHCDHRDSQRLAPYRRLTQKHAHFLMI